MIKSRSAAKGSKLEKPRPLRAIQRTISDPGKHNTSLLAAGDMVKLEDSYSTEMARMDCLVKQLEEGQRSVNLILDLCQLLHDKGLVLETVYADGVQRCFSTIRSICKEDSVSKDLRLLLIDLVELRANNWEHSEIHAPVNSPSPPPVLMRQKSMPVACVRSTIPEIKEEVTKNSSWSDSSVDTVELNVSFQNPIEVKWNAAGHMWQCEMVIPSDKVERVRGKTKYRTQVMEILKTSKMIISKDEVWNHRQIALLGKKNEIRKAAKFILDVVNKKASDTSKSSVTRNSYLDELISDTSDLSNSKNLNCNFNNNCLDVSSKSSSVIENNEQKSGISSVQTVDEEVQTVPEKISAFEPVTPTKWEQQSLLQFRQGTLCLCARSIDKAVLAEAKEVLKEHFYTSAKQNISMSSQPSPAQSHQSGNSLLTRSKSADDKSSMLKGNNSTDIPYVEVSRTRSDMGGYMRSLSTPERSSNLLHVPRLRYDRCEKGDDSSAFGSCKSDSLLDENLFTQQLMDQLKLPEERGARVSSSTPDGTPDGSLAVSPMSDISGKENYHELGAHSADAETQFGRSVLPVTLLPSQLRSIVDGVVNALTMSKVPAFLNRVEKHASAESTKTRVKTVRQPLVAGCEAGVDEVELSTPRGMFTPQGRRAMFKRYSDQVLKAQGSFDQIKTQDDIQRKLSYSWSDLLACAKSSHAKTAPAEWSYLKKIFPEVCLEQVQTYFDPTKYMESSQKKIRYPFGKFILKPTSDLEQKNYITEEQLETSLDNVEDNARDQ